MQSEQAILDLPPDVIRMLARAALAAEGDSLAAWLRLSMVSRMWRQALADAPVVVDFRSPMEPDQQHWLRATRVRVRRLAFHVDDAASSALLHDPSTLTASEGTLEEAEGVHVSPEGPHWTMQPASLARFAALRRLWLRQVNADTLESGLLNMPLGLRELVLDAAPDADDDGEGVVEPPPALAELGDLPALERFELRGYSLRDAETDSGGLAGTQDNYSGLAPGLKVMSVVAHIVRLSDACNMWTGGCQKPRLEAEGEAIVWSRGELLPQGDDRHYVVGNVSLGFGEVWLRAQYLCLETKLDAPPLPVSRLQPRPTDPAEALVDWLQAAPSTLQRCRVYVDPDAEHPDPADLEATRPGMCLQWTENEGQMPDLGTWLEPGEVLSVGSAAELLVAVSDFAAARGVSVALDEDGACVVLDRPLCSVHGSEVCKTDTSWGVHCENSSI